MAEFLVHLRSGMGCPASRAQGKVSCCPSITLVTEGLIPMSGATESERAQPLRTLLRPKEGKPFIAQYAHSLRYHKHNFSGTKI